MPIPPVTLGRIVENRIIELLIVFSGGALVAYRPESDFEGTDLIVPRRHKPGELRLQIKGRAPGNKPKLHFMVPAASQPEGDPKYLVLSEYDLARATLGKWVWVIRTDEFRRLAIRARGQWQAEVTLSNTSRDQWVDFRYNTNDLA